MGEMYKDFGDIYSHNLNEMIETNFYCNIESMKATCNLWKGRNLSILGKITVIKSSTHFKT